MQWVVTELRHKGIVLLANATALGPEEVVSLQTYCFEIREFKLNQSVGWSIMEVTCLNNFQCASLQNIEIFFIL